MTNRVVLSKKVFGKIQIKCIKGKNLKENDW